MFDITDLVGNGRTFRLRFGEVDFHQGVGNVSVDFTAAGAVPAKTELKKYR